jgi:hypothetical protein
MEDDAAPPSRARRLAGQVYDAHGSGRIVWLDGPWWVAAGVIGALCVLSFAPGHWKWLALPVLAVLGWFPAGLHWVRGVTGSVSAFKDGFRGG